MRRRRTSTISPDKFVLGPSVAWNGRHFLVVWQDGETLKIEGTRLDENGQPLPGAELLILSDRKRVAESLTVMSHGEKFVAAWTDSIPSQISVSIVEPDGAVRGPLGLDFSVQNEPRPALLRTVSGGLLLYYDRNVPEPPYLNVRRIFGTGTTGFSMRRRPGR